jgi:hypothetical protein
LIFERRVFRRIFGANKDTDNYWRMKTNIEMKNLNNRKVEIDRGSS